MGGIEPDHEIKHSHEYRAITTHISSKPQPLGAAIDAFCEPAEDKFMTTKSASEVEAQLWHSWKAVIAAATQTSHDSAGRQKLADFVLELPNRPALQHDGRVCKVWDAVVWKDLPVFGPAMREAWNASKCTSSYRHLQYPSDLRELIPFSAATDSSHHHVRTAWLNLNAFAATLVATIHSRNLDINPSGDFSLYAIWTIRMALEDHDAQQEKLDKTSLQAAAAWFAYAAPALWDFSSRGKEFEGKVAKQGGAMQGKEWRGFGAERWEAWEQGLDASGEDELVKKARDAVKAAKEGSA